MQREDLSGSCHFETCALAAASQTSGSGSHGCAARSTPFRPSSAGKEVRGLRLRSIGSATQLTYKRGDRFRGQIGTLSEHGMTKAWKLNQRNAVGVIGFK